MYRATLILRSLGLAVVTGVFVAVLAVNSQEVAPPRVIETRDIPQQMMDAHDCWSGQAPADMRNKIPAHAVVELDARRGPQYVGSQIGFDIWLHGHPGTLYGFCR